MVLTLQLRDGVESRVGQDRNMGPKGEYGWGCSFCPVHPAAPQQCDFAFTDPNSLSRELYDLARPGSRPYPHTISDSWWLDIATIIIAQNDGMRPEDSGGLCRPNAILLALFPVLDSSNTCSFSTISSTINCQRVQTSHVQTTIPGAWAGNKSTSQIDITT